MLDNLNVENCVDILNMAVFFDTAACIRTPVLDFVCRNISRIAEEDFQFLQRDSLVLVLSREQLAVEDEMILFHLLVSLIFRVVHFIV